MMYAAIITKTIRILVIFHSKNLLSKQASILTNVIQYYL